MGTPLCQICANRPATYVCRTCGQTVCNGCFDPARWSCSECLARANLPAPVEQAVSPFSAASWLFFIAFAMITIGMILMVFGSFTGSGGGISGGAVILIGPIPIVLGAGPYSVVMILLAAILTVFALAFYLLLRRKAQR